MAYGKKEFNFYNHPWESFLFIDIETVAREPELMENTPLYDSFEYKMRYAEEAQRKDFSAYNLKALFANKAALYPEFGKVVAITIGKLVDGSAVLHTFKNENEADLLTRFFTALSGWIAKDPELVLCGVNLKFFDLRFCFIRGVVNQIEPVKGHINLTGLKPWEVRTADLTDVWKQTSMYNAPLICMAECLGLPSPKSDIDGSQVSETYWKEGKKGLDRIVTYCERDVFTTINIARKLRFEPIVEMASLDTSKKENKKEKSNTLIDSGKMPPIIQKIFNVGSMTSEDEETLIKRSRKSSVLEKIRLVEVIKAAYGKNELDEEFVSKITKK